MCNIDNKCAPPPRKIVELDYKRNSLNTLKILAAIQVAYLHTITHLNVQMPDVVTKIFSIFMGVPIFFVLSGFLIWNSIGKTKSIKDYAYKRATRIFPELWLGVLIELVLLIILLKEKINWLLFGAFAIGQATVFQFYTPDFLRSFGCGTPNGTLWTMGVTIQFYIAIWFIHKLLKNKNIYWWISTLAICFAIKGVSPLISNALPGIIGKLYGQTLLPYLWLFMLGAFIARYQDKAIPFLKKIWWILLPLSFLPVLLSFDIGLSSYGLLTYTLRLPALIGLCYALPSLNIKFDFSYGMFIYHMIVVNFMIELGFCGKIHHLIIALVVSATLACGSTLFGKLILSVLAKKKINGEK